MIYIRWCTLVLVWLGVLSFAPPCTGIHRVRLQTEQQLSASSNIDQTFQGVPGTLSVYNDHVYLTDSSHRIKYLSPSLSVNFLPNTLSQISYDGSTVCGVNPAQVRCSKGKVTSDTFTSWQTINGPAGAASQIVVHGPHLLAVNSYSNIYFATYNATTNTNGQVVWTKMTGALSQVTFDGTTVCGVNQGNQIFCTDSGLVASPTWRQISGICSQVSIHGKTLLCINSGGQIFMGKYTAGTTNVNWEFVHGELHQITIDPITNKMFGLSSDGKLWWSDVTSPSKVSWHLRYDGIGLRQTTTSPQTTTSSQITTTQGLSGTLSVYNDHVYLTDSSHRIKHLSPSLSVNVLPNMLSQISYDGSTVCGVNPAQIIYCSKGKVTSDTFTYWQTINGPAGAASQIVVHGPHLLAVNSRSNIYFATYNATTNTNGQVVWTKMTGTLSQVTFDGTTVCGVNPGNQIFCTDSGLVASPTWRQIQGSCSQVSIYGKTLLCINNGDQIFIGTYSTGIRNVDWQNIPGRMHQITIDPITNKIWGLSSTGLLRWSTPPGQVSWQHQTY